MSRKRSKSPSSRGKAKDVPPASQKRKDGSSSASKKSGGGLWPSPAAWREIVESVVIAFVLAFLFRTFEAEAFVIPTGSMAPTLLGRHKDVVCPECGCAFQVSASDEVDSNTGGLTGKWVVGATCPMCRCPIDLSSGNSQGETYESYKGDRILVVKFPYQFGDPERWDVAVFKYPGSARVNFIKRLVGLPGETLVISHGDLYTKPSAEGDSEEFGGGSRYGIGPIDLDAFTIARKPTPRKIRAMLQPVYDNDWVAARLFEAGWPARWAPAASDGVDSGWTPSDDHRSFRTDGSAKGEAWIEYRHIVPSCDDWQYLRQGRMPPDEKRPNKPKQPKPQLITDFSAYNTDVVPQSASYAYGPYAEWETGGGYSAYGQSLGEPAVPEPAAEKLGLHWVGDLAVECEMEVESQSGEAILELVEGGRLFQCRIDVATGRATMSASGLSQFHPTARTEVRGPGTYDVMFSNIDDQLLLWIDGSVVPFRGDTTYPRLGNTRPQPEDLRPVRIGSRGAALDVRHLKIYRDIYYIAQRGNVTIAITDFIQSPYSFLTQPTSPKAAREELARVLSDPTAWDPFASTRQVAFTLGKDQFLVLGDNSAESKDSRLWESEGFHYYVGRDLLIGEALFVYWPHSLDEIPGIHVPFHIKIPFTDIGVGFPNFARMHFVR
jgi:signal peptidase I